MSTFYFRILLKQIDSFILILHYVLKKPTKIQQKLNIKFKMNINILQSNLKIVDIN